MREGSENGAPWTHRAALLLPIALGTLLLARAAITAVLASADVAAVPLDDSYIHFQYARSIAELHPFRYTAGAAPTPGATSLLWPLLLAPFYALGFHGERLVWIAWGFGFAALALLSYETGKLSRGLVRDATTVAAGALVLAFGGFTWFAASGMEVVPFAWLLTRTTRRAAEWVEAARGDAEAARWPSPSYRELLVLAALCPLMRPEGVVGVAIVASALWLAPHGKTRLFALPPLAGPLVPPLVAFVFTGQAMASTARAKWLPLNPYQGHGRLWSSVFAHVQTFFGTLLDGRLWTTAFLPEGFRSVFWLGLASIPLAAWLHDRRVRGAMTLVLALTILVPTTYETFLVNRLRYIWPFIPAWFVGLTTLADVLGDLVERFLPRLSLRGVHVSVLLSGAAVGLLGARIGPSIDDLASSTAAITAQQVSLARWAKDELPERALLGINDTGAIAYFSGHSTFDIVGLTTAGEARFWSAGAGSRFEHYEKLPAQALPTHFIVYPEWFGMEPLLGEELQSRTVRHTILGGTKMAVFVAEYDVLRSGERPLDARFAAKTPLDVLDVADMDDEATHGYELFDATDMEDVVVADHAHADGARLARAVDAFSLRVAPGGTVVARLGAAVPTTVVVRIDGVVAARVPLGVGGWEEVTVPVPAGGGPRKAALRLEAEGSAFASLHYWSYE
jgi:hypothetical protein